MTTVPIRIRTWPRLLFAAGGAAFCATIMLLVGPLPRNWLGFLGYTLLFLAWFMAITRTRKPAYRLRLR